MVTDCVQEISHFCIFSSRLSVRAFIPLQERKSPTLLSGGVGKLLKVVEERQRNLRRISGQAVTCAVWSSPDTC